MPQVKETLSKVKETLLPHHDKSKSAHDSRIEDSVTAHQSDTSTSSMSLPKTYKVALFEEKGEPLVFKQVDLKLPGPGEILIKVLASGVCHSDWAVGQQLFGNPLPRVPGHEVIGEVVAVPETETKWKKGDRVGAAWHGGHDGTCKQCQHGRYQMCSSEQINGVTRDGGYGEYVTLRTEAVVSIPQGDPAEFAPFLCAGVTTFNSLRNQGIMPGEVVAIQGLGGLGHLAVQYSNYMGYRTVALSSSGAKEDFARKLGAHDYIDGSKDDVAKTLQSYGGAACIVLTAPNANLVPELLKGLAPLGKLLVLAAVGPITVDTGAMIGKGLSVSAWPSGHARDAEETIEFGTRHGVKCLVEKFSLDDANKAMDHMMSGNVRFRAVITP